MQKNGEMRDYWLHYRKRSISWFSSHLASLIVQLMPIFAGKRFDAESGNYQSVNRSILTFDAMQDAPDAKRTSWTASFWEKPNDFPISHRRSSFRSHCAKVWSDLISSPQFVEKWNASYKYDHKLNLEKPGNQIPGKCNKNGQDNMKQSKKE